MNWKINLVILTGIFLTSCNNNTESVVAKQKVSIETPEYASTEHLIEVEELAQNFNNPELKLIHFGKPEEFSAGHLPGSINIWRSHIENNDATIKGLMASKTNIEALFSSLGVSNKHTLIVYDSSASCDAARLWWVLANYGFTKVRILNGGIQAWKQAQGVITTSLPVVTPTVFKLPDNAPMDLNVDHNQLLAALSNNPTPTILDARTFNEYAGIRQKSGAFVAGRIPNSTLMDWGHCVNLDGDKKFKSYSQLKAIYDSLLPDKNQAIIAYCHSGVRSSHTIFVLKELLGYTNVKNYDGSWIEWSQLNDYPKINDSITTILN